MKRSVNVGLQEAQSFEKGEKAGGEFPGYSNRSFSRRLPFNRADVFGAIMEAATSSPEPSDREPSFAFHEFIGHAQALRNSCEPRMVAIAGLLLDVIDEIAVARAQEPFAPGALLPASTGAFMLAIDLVIAKDPVALLERTKRTLHVPHELAERIISVLRETDW